MSTYLSRPRKDRYSERTMLGEENLDVQIVP